ncbi:ABC transporter permease [Natrinema sp. LN54]|uniref:ABC transporter permease n=1 Tax=Natrinema sp. LN54 TaxID=3458705 RepID=UPI0040353C8A
MTTDTAADSADDRSVSDRATSKGSRLRLSEPYALSLPTVAWFTAFLLLPLAVIGFYSFMSYSSFSVIYEFTLDPWARVFTDGTVRAVFVRTIGTGILVTLLTLVFAYPIAYYLRFYTSELGGIILLLFLVIPFWTSELIRTIAWFPILGRSGAINWVLLSIGIIDEPLRWLIFSLFSQVVGYLQNFLVFMAAPIYISLSQIDEDLLDASETLRADSIATFRNVTWPLSLPGVAIGCMFTFVLAIGNLTIPQFLSSGSATLTGLIYQEVQRGLHYPNASAMSIMLLVVIFAFVFALFRVVDISEIAQN